jgi:hypothetical protein
LGCCRAQVQAKFWIFWISILIPVVYVIIGAVVGFVMGITSGSILAGGFAASAQHPRFVLPC